jgi:hypothetical protein
MTPSQKYSLMRDRNLYILAALSVLYLIMDGIRNGL